MRNHSKKVYRLIHRVGIRGLSSLARLLSTKVRPDAAVELTTASFFGWMNFQFPYLMFQVLLNIKIKTKVRT